MEKVKLDQVKVGAILAHDVKDLNGRVLLKQGSEVSQKSIKIFKTWGVSEILVEGYQDIPEEKSKRKNFDTKKKEKIEQEVRELFRHTDLRHPAIRELIQVCIKRKMKAAEKEEN